jgi:heavy metal sensor kinase
MKSLQHLWPLGIRLQLMLWYSAVFAVLMLLAGTLFYTQLRTMLARSLDTALQLQAQQIAGDITYDHGTMQIQDATAELPGFEVSTYGQPIPPPPADVNLDVLVRVLTVDGQPFRTTPAFRALRVPTESITQPLHGIPWQETVTSADGQPVRLYSRALTQDGRIFGVVQVGTSLTQLQTTLHEVVIELLLLAPVVLVLSALVSYWLAARAFVPIARLTCIAREIKAGDLRQRVTIPRAHDEVYQLALTLNEMIDSLEQAFVRQRRFVADASHELRTPVTVIRNKTEMALLQLFPPEEHLNLFRGIHAEAERLGSLISDLLALTHADEGQVRLEREVVRLDQLVQAVGATAELLAAERQVTLEVRPAEPVTVCGDEARLIQVVMNLLENAISYTQAGGQVTLSVQAKNAHAWIVVRDTGIGIAPEHLPHIFDRFYRVDSARTRTDGDKSGLGLSIVDWVVRAHGGSVMVESHPGQGSIFTVMLPLLAEE